MEIGQCSKYVIAPLSFCNFLDRRSLPTPTHSVIVLSCEVSWDRVCSSAPFADRAAATAIAVGDTSIILSAGFTLDWESNIRPLNDVWSSVDAGGIVVKF